MDFAFSEEQLLLRNSIERFLADHYAFETRRKVAANGQGWRPEVWEEFAGLGLLGIPFSENHGGLGGSPIDIMIVMEAFGRGLVVEPYLPTVVLGGGLLRLAGTKAQQDELLPDVIAGDLRLAFAYAEPKSRYDLADVTTSAKKSGSGFVLNGYKSVVFGAPFADKIIVSARTSGAQRDHKGITLFIVDLKMSGVSKRDYPTVDGLRASEIVLENVAVPADAVVGEVDHGLALIERVSDEAIAALSAEALGCMQALNEATTEYCKTRKQFGVPIGKFQVLQHRMVDMFMAYQQSVSITYMVTLKLNEAEDARKMAASSAKVQIGKAGRFIGQEAVQLHGGMGMTDELKVGHYFKRLSMIDTQFGNVSHHLKRYSHLTKGRELNG